MNYGGTLLDFVEDETAPAASATTPTEPAGTEPDANPAPDDAAAVQRIADRRARGSSVTESMAEAEEPAVKRFDDRDYQSESVVRIFDDWMFFRSTVAVLATGAGKTPISTKVCARVLAGEIGEGDFLFVVHTDNLVKQAYKTFRRAFPNVRVEVEKAERYASDSARIVVASMQSLGKKHRCESFAKNRFAAIGFDEAHHVVKKNKNYGRIIDHFESALYFGVTATPTRADKERLAFDTMAIHKPMELLIPEGWLVPVYQVTEYCQGVKLPEKPGDRDWSDEEIQRALMDEGSRGLWDIANAAIKWSNYKGRKRRTVVFCPGVESAVLVRDILNRNHAANGTGAAAVIHHKIKGDDRDAIMAMYKRDEIRYLVNNNCLTEGFDDDFTSVVVVGRMTKQREPFVQMAGRGTRPLEEILSDLAAAPDAAARRAIIKASRKPGALIVDMQANPHRLSVNLMDVLGGKVSDGIRNAAKRNAKAGEIVEPEKMITRAEVEEKERKRAEARKGLIVESEFVTKIIDPFDPFTPPARREPRNMAGKPITEKQAACLIKWGFPESEVAKMSRFAAKQQMDLCIDRMNRGLCSYKMSRILMRHGYDPNSTADEAKTILEHLKANVWKRNRK